MNYFLSLLLSVLSFTVVSAQFGIGAVVSNDIYQRYSNPSDDIAYGGAGSTLLNIGVGPKIWLGNPSFSVSAEAQANLGLFGLGLKDYKGLGMVSFPLMAKLNFAGLSGLDREGRFGLSIGGGLQWNKTELYYLKNSFEDQGVTRDYFKTYVGEIAYGFGISGFSGQVYLRVGVNPDEESNSFNFGLKYDFNIPKLRKITDPASEL